MTTPPNTDYPCHLSVIIPAYNEELRLARSLPAILDYLHKQSYTWEVLVVNDGSRDDTVGVAERFGGDHVRVITNQPNRGKGYSIRRGMLEAGGKWRLFTDADMSTPIEDLDKFWPVTEQGYDVVIASRALPDSKLEVRQPKSREFIGRVFNSIVQTFLVRGIGDTQCGFKLFSGEAANAVFPRQTLHGFAFDVEILMLAQRLGFKIKEAPVKWVNDPGSKVSTLNGMKGFFDLACLCARRFKS
jgi:dolichyl-phosphate beta-glucosyltransferase